MKQEQKIFSIGDTNIDLFTYCDEKIISGEEHHAKKFSLSIGGNAANFAVSISSLGLEVELVSAIGHDIFTQEILACLSNKKIKKKIDVFKEENCYSNIFLKKAAERAIISNKGCMLKLTSGFIWKKISKKLKENDIVFFGGYYHLTGMHKGFIKLLEKIKRKGAIVAFDATFDENGKWDVSFLRMVDYFFLDFKEFEKITNSKKISKGIKFLFEKGAKRIILKMGKRGAGFFSPNKTLFAKAVNVNSLNSTGAGDAFNAGFIYGLIRGYCDYACLKIANFVAARKVAMLETREKEVLDFVKSSFMTEVIVCKNSKELSQKAFFEIAEQLKRKQDSVFSFAAGKTPIETYHIVKNSNLDFSKAVFIQLDEYLGVKKEDSFSFFIKKNLFGKKRFKKAFFFSTNEKKAKQQVMLFKKILKKYEVDLVVLGIGKNGHIAFNEPGSDKNSKVRIVYSKKKAITLGIKDILSAKKTILLASGKEKLKPVYKALYGKISSKLPASFLRLHKNCTFIVDKEALIKNA